MSPKDQEKRFKKEYAKELLSIAKGDFESAKALNSQEHKGRPENIVFLAQQVMEKSFKAVLCAREIPVPLVHDLGALIAKLPEDTQCPLGYELIAYNDYAAIRRYEEGRDSLEAKEISTALAHAKTILDWATKTVNS